MKLPISTLYLPVYFLTAWLMSNRGLTEALAYRLPPGMSYQVPSIRRFWIYDLLLSSIALPIAAIGSHYAAFSLLDDAYGDVEKNLWVLVYAAAFALMGFFWPKLCAVSIHIGSSGAAATELSLAAVRDRFLGGETVRVINAELQRDVERYLERVHRAISASPLTFKPFLLECLKLDFRNAEKLTDTDLQALETALRTSAQTDFAMLYAAVCEAEMIPFRDRTKPLMRIPDIT